MFKYISNTTLDFETKGQKVFFRNMDEQLSTTPSRIEKLVAAAALKKGFNIMGKMLSYYISQRLYLFHMRSTTLIPRSFINNRIVPAVTVQRERRLAFNSGVSALFTEQLS